MTEDQRADLEEVNGEVNAIPYDAIAGASEGSNLWKDTPDGGSWVCRDYVLRKEMLLRQRGWSPLAMTVVECWTETEEHHAVLAVETGDPQPWILDSRFDRIYLMNEPPAAYRWERRQIPGSVEFEQIG